MSGDKTLLFKFVLGFVFVVFSLRLFYLQIYDDKYKELSQNNIVHLEPIFPSRGIITDRYDSILVENQPSYDFNIVPKQFYLEDTFQLLNSFAISTEELIDKINTAKKYY